MHCLVHPGLLSIPCLADDMVPENTVRVEHQCASLGVPDQVSQTLARTDPRAAAAAAGALFLGVLFLAVRTSATLVGVLLVCAALLGFATWLAQWVMAKDEGTVDMQEVRACSSSGF